MKTTLDVWGVGLGLLVGALAFGCGGPERTIMTPEERLAEEEQKAYEAEQAEKKRRAEEGEPVPEEPAAKAFDEKHAQMELKRATRNAESCTGVVADSKERGEATVNIVFTNDGSVSQVRVSAPFDGTRLGDCITNAYKAVLVPPFDGGDHPMSWDLTLKDPPAEEKGKGKK
jgi:hypothetical protein